MEIHKLEINQKVEVKHLIDKTETIPKEYKEYFEKSYTVMIKDEEIHVYKWPQDNNDGFYEVYSNMIYGKVKLIKNMMEVLIFLTQLNKENNE